jgi:hypothetical protein
LVSENNGHGICCHGFPCDTDCHPIIRFDGFFIHDTFTEKTDAIPAFPGVAFRVFLHAEFMKQTQHEGRPA